MNIEIEARHQFAGLLTSTSRWSVVVAHRRAGKTVACIQKLLVSALHSKGTRPRYAYIAPFLKQAKTVAWDYLKMAARQIPGAGIHESELRVDFTNGAQIRLYGADNPDALRGIYLDGVVLDEAADMSPRIFPEILRPALSDREGWAIWIGTPKGMNSFYELWAGDGRDWVGAINDPEWFTLMLKASETGLVKEKELLSNRKTMSADQYQQEYECSFTAAIVGAYYGREMEACEAEGRIVERLYDPAIEVHTAWDLGASDDTVIWFYQQSGMDIRLVDYYAANGWGLDHYAKVLAERGYRYGRHHLPHDVEMRVLTGGEIARTRKQTLEGLGVPVTVVPKWSVEDGINAVRRILPRCWFDKTKTAEGIKALRQYRREYDEVRKTFVERPLHDWASHPADAARYLAISVTEPATSQKNMPKPNRSWVV
jgi:phage terminase large subunit